MVMERGITLVEIIVVTFAILESRALIYSRKHEEKNIF